MRVGTPEWEALTERRAGLIYKKNRERLNAEEATELAILQQLSREAIAAFPPLSSMFDDLGQSERILPSADFKTP